MCCKLAKVCGAVQCDVGLNSAMSSTGSALEHQAHKLVALGHKITATQSDVVHLKDAMFGSGAAARDTAAEALGFGTPRMGQAQGTASVSAWAV